MPWIKIRIRQLTLSAPAIKDRLTTPSYSQTTTPIRSTTHSPAGTVITILITITLHLNNLKLKDREMIASDALYKNYQSGETLAAIYRSTLNYCRFHPRRNLLIKVASCSAPMWRNTWWQRNHRLSSCRRATILSRIRSNKCYVTP